MKTQDPIEKIKEFVNKLEFTEAEIQDYAREFDIPQETMRKMAKRITRELKHDIEKTLG